MDQTISRAVGGRKCRGVTVAGVALLIVAVVPRAAMSAELLPPDIRRPVVKCQADIVKAGVKFVSKKLKQLDRCAASVFECVHRRPGEQACLDRATTRCEKAIGKIIALEGKFTTRILDRCGDLDPATLLATFGLGYDGVAADCASDYGAPLTDAASIAACIVLQHECLAERIFDTHEPRAAEFLDLVGADLGPASCLEDRGGVGDTIAEPSELRTLGKCQGALRKASSAFVGQKLKQLGRCLKDLFSCEQLDAGDPTCLARARDRCDKAFAKIEKRVLKLADGVRKGCAGLSIGVLTAPDGLGANGLLPLCDSLGVFGIGSSHDYGNCVVRQHECAVDEIARFAVPRAAALLGPAGRSLPGEFFCPTPIPAATPTPVPTP